MSNPTYPQLNNLYPAPPSGPSGSSSPVPPSQSSTPGVPPSSGPSAGPGAGFAPKPAAGPGSGYTPYNAGAGFNNGRNAYAGAYGTASGGGLGRGMGGSGAGEEKNVAQLIVDSGSKYQRAYQTLLDRSSPMTVERWCFTGGLFIVFALNVVIRQGWYIVCYALAIYLLNLFLAFLQPKFDPSIQQDLAQEDVEEGAPGLPGAGKKSAPGGIKGLMTGFSTGEEDEEFRPFIRRLPEFKFWLSATKATLLALFSTITRATDIPVYWPILLVYFFVLFGLTMRRQVQHMIKFRYSPFDIGRKATYGKNKK